MTAPSFLATAFTYNTLTGTTDVSNIMSTLATMLTSTLPTTVTNQWPNGQRWTNPSGNTYKSPPDAAGKFMLLTLTRPFATRMQWTVSDTGGILCDGVMNINAAGSNVELYAGPGHAIVAALNGAAWETCRTFMTDPSPEPLAANIASYVFAQTQRTTGAVDMTPSMHSYQFRFYAGTLSNVVAPNYGAYAIPFLFPQDTTNTHLKTQAGSEVVQPMFNAIPSANAIDDWKVSGRQFQTVTVDANNAAGSEIAVPIDTGVTGTFKVWRGGASGCRQWAFRKA